MADELSLYTYWLEKLPADDPLHAELEAVEGNEKEIGDRFYQEIVFGTAGLRGICGAGTNRMNRLTVGRATKGIADFILGSRPCARRRSCPLPSVNTGLYPAST